MRNLSAAVLATAGLVAIVVAMVRDQTRMPSAGGRGGRDVVLAEGCGLRSTAGIEQAATIRSVVEAARAARGAAPIKVDYPQDQSVFPPNIVAPTVLWHDPVAEADTWLFDMTFAGSRARIQALVPRGPLPEPKLDPRCVTGANTYERTAYQATAVHWQPSTAVWKVVKKYSVERPATVTVLGFSGADPSRVLSRGQVTITTSEDPVAAPIFYRDVPLMPTENKDGIIKPISDFDLPSIAWRLRDIARPNSRLLMTDLPTCANCHSFSADGKTLGMDLDGPNGDKGTYCIAPIAKRMTIDREHTITWNAFNPHHKTIGFMSQISPDGQYAVTTLNEEVYVKNFKDYRFLQVFYPTGGILAYYSKAADEMKALPGADNQYYVHCDPVWTPDGEQVVFARATARPPKTAGQKLATHANDPNETPIQYSLYRMPFNSGLGGKPVPIAGASENGMSNTFPKVTPDGKFVVFVKCKNGQLMRPDSELWIVPLAGGEARRMRSNLRLMNSWHSFSPNGRWMVFSSKANTPYTQMFLTHIDEQGHDTPAILIENATAANRAVNIPEFVNRPYDDFLDITITSLEYRRYATRGEELMKDERIDEAIAELKKALDAKPDDAIIHAKIHNNLSRCYGKLGQQDLAGKHFKEAMRLKEIASEGIPGARPRF